MLGKRYFEHAILKSGFDFILIHGIGKAQRTLEAAVAALHHTVIFFLLVILDLLLTLCGQDTVLQGQRNVLFVRPRKLNRND